MDISRPCQPEKLSLYCPDQDSIPVSQDTMIDEQSSASGHDYASDRSAIGADVTITGTIPYTVKPVFRRHLYIPSRIVSQQDRCPFISGSLTLGRSDSVMIKCPLIGVSLEYRFYCTLCQRYLFSTSARRVLLGPDIDEVLPAA